MFLDVSVLASGGAPLIADMARPPETSGLAAPVQQLDEAVRALSFARRPG